MGELLQLQDINKRFGKESILSGISLTLNAEEAIAITGDSGSGKTTLLSIMGILQSPSEGKVLIAGKEADKLSENEKAKLRGEYFGFVFQRTRLINSLTALENVLLPSLFIHKNEKLDQRARNLLIDFGLKKRLNYKPEQLSLGQLRRVSLARALLLRPKALLADEPTNDLDPELADNVAKYLIRARNLGAGVVIVTHNPFLAARADKIYDLKDGKLQRGEVQGKATAQNS